MEAIKTHYRTCNLCEAMCGLKIEHDGTKIISIKGDKEDVLSKGHICPKAIALQDLHFDKDRLKTPVKKVKNSRNNGEQEWVEISWEAAYKEIATKLKEIQKKHGHNAIGTYRGNPNVHNLGMMLFGSTFIQGLKTQQKYSATSVDQLPHHISSLMMFGHHMMIPIPDIDHTDFMLIIGANPVISNGSMMSAPDFSNRLKALKKRGGQFVVIDPRYTETAKIASHHHFIHPGKDAFLLLSLIHVIFEEKLDKPDLSESYIKGWQDLIEIAKDYAPVKTAALTGISAIETIQLARSFAAAKSAVCYGRLGVSTQEFGGICQWLINALNIITGNLDKKGGAMFTLPAIDLVGMSRRSQKTGSFDRRRSRVRNLPEYSGEYPVATLADEILTEGEGQIKAMITIAGNPVLSTPNGKRLADALQNLEFMVAIDIYINETTQYADIILPSTTGLEAYHYDLAFHQLAIRNTAKFSQPLFKKTIEQKHDWEIFQELGKWMFGVENSIHPEAMLDQMLRIGPYAKSGISLKQIKINPHGIDLGPLKPCLPERLFTTDKKIELTPKIFIEDLKRLNKEFRISYQRSISSNSFKLIGRRHLRSNNSWMHNSKRLTKGKNLCTLLMNTADAKEFDLENKTMVEVRSKTGSVKLPLEINDGMMPGVVSIPHGWGHHYKNIKLEIAKNKSGVSINDLTDNNRIDKLTGNADFSGTPVEIHKIEPIPDEAIFLKDL